MKAYKQMCRSKLGFTLVEVTLALGIFSFGVVGLVGLLPVALQTHQSSKQDTVIAQIVQRLTSEIQLTDYEKLDALNSQDFHYFDQSGLEVSNTSGNRIYTAQTVVVASSALPGFGASPSLKTVKLFVVFDPKKTNVIPATPVTSLLIGKSDPSSP